MRDMKGLIARAVRWRCLTMLVVVLMLGLVVGLAAQSQEAAGAAPTTNDQTAVFRSGITLVTTDVIPRDGSGLFQADLTKDDFRVFEDDVQQEIASLVLVHGGRVFNQLLPPPPSQEGIILPPTRARNDTAGRIFIVFVDDLHIVTRDTPRFREVFEQMADNLIHEGDLFAIVTTGPSSIGIDLTYDRSLLYSTADLIMGDGFSPNELIKFVAPGARGPAELNFRAHTAFKTARDIIQSLAQIPNRRKAFIYFSGGYDFNPFEHERLFGQSLQYSDMRNSGDWMSMFGRGDVANTTLGIDDPRIDPFERIARQGAVFADFELAMEILELTTVANRANVSFYTIDPRGLIHGPDPDYQGGTEWFNDWQFTTQNSLRSLAELTGGKAVVNRNDFDDAFQEIDAETSDYYVVGFYSSNPDPTFRTRRLRVEANREGVDVKHRTHYTYARASEQSAAPPPP